MSVACAIIALSDTNTDQNERGYKMACEDFPCCGHDTANDCSSEDLSAWEDGDTDDLSADAEWLASAGWGTDEDYGFYE